MVDRFKQSVILMGIDWSKAARLDAIKQMRTESKEFCTLVNDLDYYYRIRDRK